MTKKNKSSLNESRWIVAAGIIAILAVLGYVYWPYVRLLMNVWEDPDYSHGYLVPFFAGFLLWVRREGMPQGRWKGSWWGVVLLAIGAAVYLAAGMLGFNLIIVFSLLPCLAGTALMLGGWSMIRWSWPAIFFLGFMIPLPEAIETTARLPLQRLAAIASTYVLQTLGLPAVAFGNVIHLSEYAISVAEACSGLRMLMTSMALTFGLAFVLKRPLWERLVVLASAVPIALLVNIIRITVTGLCYEHLGPEVADKVFHALAGWLMMPMAVGLLWLELAILTRLTYEPQEDSALAGVLATK